MSDRPMPGSAEWERRIGQVIRLADDHDLARLVAGLGELRAAVSRPWFRVCFLGAFSTGKSHLINQLVGSYVVPESESAEVSAPTLVRPLRPGDDGPQERPGTVFTDNAWLRESGLELLDTPGLWRESDADLDLTVWRLAQHSDAVVVPVRARGGGNLQERALLRRLAATDPALPVLLVITMLDHVRSDARQEVIGRYRRIGRAIDARIEVLPGPGGEQIRSLWPHHRQALRERLAELSDASERSARRARRVASVLVSHCDLLIDLAEEALAAAAADDERRAEILRAREPQYRAGQARWSSVLLEVDNSRTALITALEDRTRDLEKDLRAEIEERLSGHAAPEELWEQELVPLLHERLSAHLAETGRTVHQRLSRDADLIAAELDDIAGPRPNPSPQEPGEVEMPDRTPPRPGRSSAADLFGALVADGGGMVTGLLAGLVPLELMPQVSLMLQELASSRLAERLTERRRRAVLDLARQAVHDHCETVRRLSRQQVTDAYDRLLETARQRHDSWWEARRALWSRPGEETRAWERLRSQARHLRAEISAAARRL